jgi:hypothetical protein
MITSEQALRRSAIGDPAYCRALMAAEPIDPAITLDVRSLAVLRLGGSIGAGSPGPLLRQRVADALFAGMTFDEVVGCLIALAPAVGIDRAVALAPDVALALDHDIDAALERPDR